MSTDFRPRTPIPMADLEQRRIYDEIGLGEFEEGVLLNPSSAPSLRHLEQIRLCSALGNPDDD